MFELWLEGCRINGTKIFPVCRSGETAIYMCWREYMSGNNGFRTTPVYIGFVKARQVCATMNMVEAFGSWNNAKTGGGK